VLIRVNPENPASTTDFVCDVCTEIPEPMDGGRTYAFDIRNDVRFQDGSRLTAHDVAASWNRIVAPAAGVISARSAYYSMIDTVEAPDPQIVMPYGEVRTQSGQSIQHLRSRSPSLSGRATSCPRHIVPWDTSGENPDAFLVIHHPAQSYQAKPRTAVCICEAGYTFARHG
jgi:hypothetical protein